MAAHGEQPLGHSKVAIADSAFDQRLFGQGRAQLAPEGNAFEQRAGAIHPGQAERECRIHVEMRIDEGRADQLARRVDGRGGFAVDARFDGGDAPVADSDIAALAPVGQGGVADQKVEHGKSCLCLLGFF